MKKCLISFLLLFVFYEITLKAHQVSVSTNNDTFIFDKKEFSFGKISRSKDVYYAIFEYQNKGEKPLQIKNCEALCGCTVPTWTKQSIQKGQKGQIKVAFKTKGQKGFFRKRIIVTTNLSTKPIILKIKGTVE